MLFPNYLVLLVKIGIQVKKSLNYRHLVLVKFYTLIYRNIVQYAPFSLPWPNELFGGSQT